MSGVQALAAVILVERPRFLLFSGGGRWSRGRGAQFSAGIRREGSLLSPSRYFSATNVQCASITAEQTA
jgi:hypothetical protein